MPHHDRRPGTELHSRLRPHHRLSFGRRLRHPSRWRHGLYRRLHHPLLRPAAGQGHRLGQHASGSHQPHGPGAARIPHPRGRHQSHLPRGDHRPRAVPQQHLHDPLHRHDAGTVPAGEAPGPCDEALDLSRRRHRQRPPGNKGPSSPVGRRSKAGRAVHRREHPRRYQAEARRTRPEEVRRMGAWPEPGFPDRYDHARRPSVAAGHTHAHA
ncbi:hypothetical protein D9M70_459510 [compost metagenome]